VILDAGQVEVLKSVLECSCFHHTLLCALQVDFIIPCEIAIGSANWRQWFYI